MNTIKLSLLAAFAAVTNITFCQVDKTYDYLPPSPTAAELGKYGLSSINLSTGAMSTSVPVYTLKTANLSIPVSLNYASTGVKVDQIASNVGISWSLNAGGVITRMIRDKDDMEEFEQHPYPENTSTMNFELAEYLQKSVEEQFDSERDLYSFNFLNLTGKFVFTRDNFPLIVPFRRLGVQRIRHFEDTDFLITDENGVRYYFDVSETTRTVQQGSECGKNHVDLVETGWFISKIIHPEGDTVYFDYQNYSFSYSPSVTQTFTEKLNSAIDCSSGECPSFNEKLCKSVLLTNTFRLTRIRTNGYGDVVFHSSSTRLDIPGEYKLDSIEFVLPDNQVMNKWLLEYTFSTNPGLGDDRVTGSGLDRRMFLAAVHQKGINEPNRKSYSFAYHQVNALPKRLSFAQDHWGYFNGKSNPDFVPEQGLVALRDQVNRPLFTDVGGNREPDPAFASKGLLSKITYPTGGSDSITYEGNSFWGSKTIYPPRNYYDRTLENHSQTSSEELTIPVHSSASQDVQLNFSVSYLAGAEEDPIHCFGRISVRKATTNNYLIDNLRVNPGDMISQKLPLLPGGDYIVTIRTFGEGVKSHVYFDLYEQETQTIQTNILTGGMRVSKITSLLPATGQAHVVRYYYGAFNDLNRSSGVVSSFQPVYYQYSKSYHPCNGTCSLYECSYVTLSSNGNLNLNAFGGNNIVYRTVVVGQGNEFENGYEEHEFITSQNNPGRVVHGEQIDGAPYSNFAWDNGLEKMVSKFKKEGTTYRKVYESENTYVRDMAIDHAVSNLVVRKNFESLCKKDLVNVCDESNIHKTYSEFTCTTDHHHEWLIGGIPFLDKGMVSRCIALGAHNDWVVYSNHPCYNHAVGEIVITESELDNIDALEYRDFAYWFYLASSKETIFSDNDNDVVTVKNFRYADTTHLQLTHEYSVTSTGDTLTTKYWYPHDFDFGSFADSLKNKNIIARPLKTETYRNKKTIGGTITKYNPDGSVNEVWRRNEASASDSLMHNPSQLIIPVYELEGSVIRDDSKKPREIHYPDGKVATLIWGYGKKYLIAQVMNKSFLQVKAALGSDFTPLENSTSNSYINSKLDILRNALPTSQIISYNYNPGVGVISQTDQNKITTYYSYDSFGRVQTIKDHKGNLVKKFEYHYKTSQQ